MRKTLASIIIAAALLSFAAPLLSAQSFDNYPWGSSPRAVAAQTGAVPDSRGAGTLIKREAVLGREAYLTFRFAGGGLSAVGIQWDSDLFLELKERFSSEYQSGRCTAQPLRCEWTTPRSTLRLIGDPNVGLTLLVVSPAGRD